MATLHCKNCENPMHDSRNAESYLNESFVLRHSEVREVLVDMHENKLEVWQCEECETVALCYGFDRVEWMQKLE